MWFQAAKGSFKTSWKFDKKITASTEIYMNMELQYPDHFKVMVTDHRNEPIENILYCDVKNYWQVELLDKTAKYDG